MRIGAVAGVPVYVHATFPVLVVWIALNQLWVHRDLTAAITDVALCLAFFSCVLLHEAGHVLAARKVGVPILGILILPIGGLTRMGRIDRDPPVEMRVAAAGPVVSLGLSAGLAGLLWLSGGISAQEELHVNTGSFVGKLLVLNTELALFNLLPAFPLDGGRILRALLGCSVPADVATVSAAHVGRAVAVVFGLVGMVVNPLLLLVALYLWVVAGQEAASVRAHCRMRRVWLSRVRGRGAP